MVEIDGLKIAVACPSYRRPECRTARYIPETRIYVHPDEAEQHRNANVCGVVVACDDGIQGNLPRVRNYILDKEFGAGADVVVMMDDDVTALKWFKPESDDGFGYVQHTIDCDEFYNFIAYGTQLCRDWGFGMWGVNYNQDKMLYQHYLPFSTTKSAIGQFMVFTENELRFDENLPLKEDYDMNLQQQSRYRGVLTINFVHVIGDFGKLQGGTSVRRNQRAEFEQFKLFKKKWGSDIVRGTNKRSGLSRQHDGSKKSLEFAEKYDFSHPIVRCPIKGV